MYILIHGTRNISGILLSYRKLWFKTLNLFKNGTFLTLHVYRQKERPFKTSIFIAFTNRRVEDAKINQNVDCKCYYMYIFSLNYGKCSILVTLVPYLTHKAQINDCDRSTADLTGSRRNRHFHGTSQCSHINGIIWHWILRELCKL